MSIKLRELIRNVRACKTAAEERGVIAKECALIRTAFKEKENNFRHRNVAKLLYIHMLGYPTHFGQIESLKLIASPKFPEKRIGYLGLMVLLDERQKVLVLVTSSMRNDFKHPNQFVVGLALCSLGNISSVDMARDLASEIEKLCRHANPYIRKKAATCAIRVIRKCPELIDDFTSAAAELLNDKNHAVLLSGVQLIIEMIRTDAKHVKTFRPLVNVCVKLLRNLLLAGYVSEYDVLGITDPFLQCKLIHLLRLLGTGNKEASDLMNDILAQVAINTEGTKNPGNAILYECVMTIMSIEAESGLRVLAINILGKFLLNRDNNIRYVALQTLCKCVNRDTQAIQRHRNTVVDCLKDADISIRRRALDLIYALVTKSNVKPLVKELLNYLALASGDVEFKSDLTDKICLVVEKYAPNKLWHIETIIQVLNTAGNFTRENVSIDLIYLIARTKELYAFSVHKVYQVLKKNKVNQIPLINVGCWAIGEYGDLLVSDAGLKAASVDPTQTTPFEAVTEDKVLSLLQRFLRSPEATIVTKEYILNALAKLSSRFTKEQEGIKKLMQTYSTSMSAELQQRSIEYQMLASDKLTKIRTGVVARMPVLDKKSVSATAAASPDNKKEEPVLPQAGEKDDYDDDDDDEDGKAVPPKGSALPTKKPAAAATAATSPATKKPVATAPAPAPAAKPVATPAPAPAPVVNDPFAVMFGAGSSSSAAAPAPKKPEADFDPLASMFFAGGGASTPSPAKPAVSAAAAFNPFPSTSGGGAASFFPTPTLAAAPVANNNANGGDLMAGFFGSAAPAAAAASPSSGEQKYPKTNVFNSGGLSIDFVYSRASATPHILTVNSSVTNSTPVDFAAFDLKIAVPKYVKLTINGASGTTVPANGGAAITQTLVLDNSLHGQKPLLIRAKIVYSVNGQPKEEQTQISAFP